MENYLNTLLDYNDEVRFMDENNFIFSKDESKIATRNLRVLVDSKKGLVPKEVLMHVASIASLMLADVIDYSTGYLHILDFMKRYGYAEFRYQAEGYLHIKINKSSGNIKVGFKRPVDLVNQPKKL